MTQNNPYKALNIPPDATDDEIKDAYKSLAKKHHPDAGGDKDTFSKINNAYMILKDPEKRSYYDKHGDEKPSGDPKFNKAMEIFVGMINETVENYGDQIIYKNFLPEMTKAVTKNLTALNKERERIFRDQKHFKKLLEIFEKKMKHKKEKSKIDLFQYVMNERIRATQMNIQDLDDQEEIFNIVLDWITDFDFAFEEKPADSMDDLQGTSKQVAFNQLRQKMEQGGFPNNLWR